MSRISHDIRRAAVAHALLACQRELDRGSGDARARLERVERHALIAELLRPGFRRAFFGVWLAGRDGAAAEISARLRGEG